MNNYSDYEKNKAWLKSLLSFFIQYKILDETRYKPLSSDQIRAFEAENGLDLGDFMRAYFEVFGDGPRLRPALLTELYYSRELILECLPFYERVEESIRKMKLRDDQPHVPKNYNKILLLKNEEIAGGYLYVYPEQPIPDFLIFWKPFENSEIQRVSNIFQYFNGQFLYCLLNIGLNLYSRGDEYPDYKNLFYQIPWIKAFEKLNYNIYFQRNLVRNMTEFDKFLAASNADPYMDIETYTKAFFKFLVEEKGYQLD